MPFPENYRPNAGVLEPIDANGVELKVGDPVETMSGHRGVVSAIQHVGNVALEIDGTHRFVHAQFLAKVADAS